MTAATMIDCLLSDFDDVSSVSDFSFTLRMTYDNRQLRDSQIRESKNIERKLTKFDESSTKELITIQCTVRYIMDDSLSECDKEMQSHEIKLRIERKSSRPRL